MYCVHVYKRVCAGLQNVVAHRPSPLLLYLGLTPSPLQAQEGGGVKEEWTVGHLQRSSLTWLDHLAPLVAQ